MIFSTGISVHELLVILYLLPACLSSTPDKNDENLQSVCGSVRTTENKTVTLRDGVSLTSEQFENVHLRKLKDALVSPEKDCVINVCGYTWTEKAFSDLLQSGIMTRNYAGCQRIKQGTEYRISSNIYNDLFNVSSISCGCKKPTSNCKVTCSDKIKSKIGWKENQCAILYEEENCGHCWFPPTFLSQGENYTTDNSHFIRTMLIREYCTVRQTFPDKGDNRTNTTLYEKPATVTTKSSFQRGFSTFDCNCHTPGNTTTEAPTKDITTASSITYSATHFYPASESAIPIITVEPSAPFQSTSCASVKPINSSAIQLFENGTLDRQTYENVRVGKLKHALLRVGSNSSDRWKCVLEICGFNNLAPHPYKYGSCEWYSGTIMAPTRIYTGHYEISSMSCACSTHGRNNCTADTCLFENSTKAWHGRECAIMYQEIECRSCFFKPVSLMYGADFLSLNSYQIKSMLVRPGCHVEKATNGALWADAPWTFKYEGVDNDTEPTFYKDSENYTCVCTHQVISEMLTETTTLKSITTEISITESTTFSSSDNNKTVISITQYVIIGIGIVVVAVIGTLLAIRFKNKGTLANNCNMLITRSSIEIKNGEYNEEAGQESISDKKPLGQGKSFEIEMHGIPNESSPGCSSEESGSECHTLSSVTQAEEEISRISDESSNENENQLKTQIMDELKKLLEPFIGHLVGQGEISSFGNGHYPTGHNNENDRGLHQLLEQLQQVCHENHILLRDAFTIPENNWKNPIGNGKFGIVYEGWLKSEPDGLVEKVALKWIKWPGSSDSVVQSFLREIKTFEHIGLGNEYIVPFLGACCNNDGLYILTKFCEGGSLQWHLVNVMRPKILHNEYPPEMTKDTGNGYFEVDTDAEQEWVEQGNQSLSPADLHKLLYFCEQITCGMEYLSLKKIIHVDLACRNILLSKGEKIQICDFGLSRKCLNKDDCAKSLLMGDFPFNSFAPECNTETVNEPRQVSLCVDIWAFGCTVWEMFTLGDPLYPDASNVPGFDRFLAIRKLLLDGYRHPKPKLAPDFVHEKLLECWQELPRDRPNFTQLHEFFEKKRTELVNMQY